MDLTEATIKALSEDIIRSKNIKSQGLGKPVGVSLNTLRESLKLLDNLIELGEEIADGTYGISDDFTEKYFEFAETAIYPEQEKIEKEIKRLEKANM